MGGGGGLRGNGTLHGACTGLHGALFFIYDDHACVVCVTCGHLDVAWHEANLVPCMRIMSEDVRDSVQNEQAGRRGLHVEQATAGRRARKIFDTNNQSVINVNSRPLSFPSATEKTP